MQKFSNNKSSIFEENLYYLSQKDPMLCDEIKRCNPDVKKYRLLKSGCGLPTLGIRDKNDKFHYLHSRYNPIEESRRYVEKKEVKGVVIVFGFGLGYHIKEIILRIKDKSNVIICIEKDINLLGMALDSRTYKDIFDYESFYLFCESETDILINKIERILLTKNQKISFVPHLPSLKIYHEYYLEIIERLKDIMDGIEKFNPLLDHFRDKGCKNLLDMFDMVTNKSRKNEDLNFYELFTLFFHVFLTKDFPFPSPKLKYKRFKFGKTGNPGYETAKRRMGETVNGRKMMDEGRGTRDETAKIRNPKPVPLIDSGAGSGQVQESETCSWPGSGIRNRDDEYIPKNILIIPPFFIGDLLTTFPLIRGIKEKYPDCRLSILLRKPMDDLLKSDDRVESIYIVEYERYKKIDLDDDYSLRSAVLEIFKFVMMLKGKKFDLIINLNMSDEEAVLTSLIGNKNVIGMAVDANGYPMVCGNTWALYYYIMTKRELLIEPNRFNLKGNNPMHPVPLILLMAGLGIKGAKANLRISDKTIEACDLFLRENNILDGDFVVGMNPGANWESKRWQKEYFAALAGMIIEEFDAKVLVFGGPDEGDLIKEIISSIKRKERAIDCSKTSLRELAFLSGKCGLFITNDTGPMYIAASSNTPILVLCGPTSMAPFSDLPNIKIMANVDCNPCGKIECEDMKCMKKLKPDVVMRAVKILLSLREEWEKRRNGETENGRKTRDEGILRQTQDKLRTMDEKAKPRTPNSELNTPNYQPSEGNDFKKLCLDLNPKDFTLETSHGEFLDELFRYTKINNTDKEYDNEVILKELMRYGIPFMIKAKENGLKSIDISRILRALDRLYKIDDRHDLINMIQQRLDEYVNIKGLAFEGLEIFNDFSYEKISVERRKKIDDIEGDINSYCSAAALLEFGYYTSRDKKELFSGFCTDAEILKNYLSGIIENLK